MFLIFGSLIFVIFGVLIFFIFHVPIFPFFVSCVVFVVRFFIVCIE